MNPASSLLSTRPLLGSVLAFAGTVWICAYALAAESSKKDGVTVVDFESLKEGEPPEEVFVIEGDITISKASSGGKVLRIGAEPIVESGALFGRSFKGGGTIKASVQSSKRRRSYPRFGLGLHGISGYRLRLVPANKSIELVKDEQVVATADYEWDPAKWCHLELQVKGTEGDGWIIEGRVWKEGEKQPVKPLIDTKSKESPGQGKASVWGTPFSGKPILFDNIRIQTGN